MPQETFSGEGSYSWTVPSGVSQIRIESWGAGGGAGAGTSFGTTGYQGGDGALVAADFSVSGGDVIDMDIGGGGGGGDEAGPGGTGGANGPGGTGGDGAPDGAGGGGGGWTEVDIQSSRVLLVGGGGGGAGDSGAFDGSPGGAGAASATGSNATAGGDAPDSSNNDGSGGGGGAGYSGGGGGSSDTGTGGGGGGSFIDGSASNLTQTDGGGAAGGAADAVSGSPGNDGRVIISYVEATAPPNNVDATYVADDQVDLSFAEDTTGGEVDYFDVQIQRDGGTWVSPDGGPTDPTSDGTYSYGPHDSAGSPKDYDASVGADASFQFRVRAVNSQGGSDWSYSDTVYTTPIPPHDPHIVRPDANTVEVNFTVKSDVLDYSLVYLREDTGSGYGGWELAELVGAEAKGPASVQMDTTSDMRYRGPLNEDARYQFYIESRTPQMEDSTGGLFRNESARAYADYGNSGNVYFKDDFSSGDASAWDTVSGSATVVGTLSADFSAGDNTQSPEVGGYAVQMGGPGYVQKSLGDLSGESDVLVRGRVQMASNDTTSEEGDVWFWDGSAWQRIDYWGWEHDGQGWMTFTAAVPDSYLSADSRVRVGRDEGGGADWVAFDEIIVSDILHEYTKPAAPTNLSLDASTEGEMTLSWTDNAAFNDSYIKRRRNTGESSWEAFAGVTGSEGTSHTESGLLDGESYDFQVYARVMQYRHGVQGPSNYHQAYSDIATGVTLLPAPTNLTTSTVTADSAEYEWTANHNYGDTRVEYKPTSDSAWQTFSTVARSTETETVTGLRNGEAYDARVVAETEHTATEGG